MIFYAIVFVCPFLFGKVIAFKFAIHFNGVIDEQTDEEGNIL